MSISSERREHDLFDTQWIRLMDRGFTDELGGAQYRRVYLAWMMEGHPRPIAGYIRSEANRPVEQDEGIES